ncbi:MAG TPA: hypothetical protein VG273_15630 [Bryobacteraceae bacterium]|jgi:hypothetical protein|nr:hypothetical protein [Bryobacteraceae bacterium]
MKTPVCFLLFTIAAVAQTPVPAGPRAVTGLPYSMEQTTERVQTLADGTRISQPAQKIAQYRDSAGRTRNEITTTVAGPGAQTISTIIIMDPVSGLRYNLDTRNHVARKMPPLSPPPQGRAAAPLALQRPDASSESLGTQVIQGITARGTRTTMTYPIGFSGNDRPIVSINEMWMSIDLRIMLQSKMSDPRFGDSTTTLNSFSQAEPDPTLFQIPADYQVVEGR